MIKFKTIIIALVSSAIVIFLSCWDKQKHEITAPKTPVYNLSGRIISSLTNESLKHVLIKLTGKVKYNDEDSNRVLLMDQITNESGMFTFTDVPGGCEYVLIAEKEGYQKEIKKVVTYYEDTNIGDIILGKWLVEEESFFFDDFKISGIVYKDGSIWIADSLNRKILELNKDLIIKKCTTLYQITPSGLAWDGQYFWISDAISDSIYRLSIDSEITFLNSYPSPSNLYHSDQKIDILDMSSYNGEIWACSKHISVKYFHFDPVATDAITYLDSPLNMYHPVGITVDSNIIYLACEYHPEARIYLIEKETNNILGYSIILDEAGLITWDSNFIWLAKDNYIRKFIF